MPHKLPKSRFDYLAQPRPKLPCIQCGQPSITDLCADCANPQSRGAVCDRRHNGARMVKFVPPEQKEAEPT